MSDTSGYDANSIKFLKLFKKYYGSNPFLGMISPWYTTPGAQEELIRRIEALSPFDKAILGIEED